MPSIENKYIKQTMKSGWYVGTIIDKRVEMNMYAVF